MGFGDSFGVLANLFVNPDHRLVNTDAVDPKIPIFRARGRDGRNVEHFASALKQVLVNRASVRPVALSALKGRIENCLSLFRAARVFPDVPGTFPEFFCKYDNSHRHPLHKSKDKAAPQRLTKNPLIFFGGPVHLSARL